MPDYRFDDHGSLVLCAGEDVITRHDPSASLGLLYDSSDGTLHKHGSAAMVREHAATVRSRLAAAGFADLAADLTVLELPVAALRTQAVLEEVNACLATSGRAARLVARLAELEVGPLSDPIPD